MVKFMIIHQNVAIEVTAMVHDHTSECDIEVAAMVKFMIIHQNVILR